MSDGVVKLSFDEYRHDWQSIDGEVIEEGFVSIFVNGAELATRAAPATESSSGSGRS